MSVPSQVNKVDHDPFDMQIKLLLIGDSGVGKTCLLLRYANNSFCGSSYETTIGIDFKIKHILLANKRVKLQMWDTAGQERFRTITTSYFRGAQGIMLLYDVTDKDTFISMRNWLQQIQFHADVQVNKILLGCKCDVQEQRAVSKEEGQNLADEYGIQFFEVSNKYNINVEEAFAEISKMTHDRLVSDGVSHAEQDLIFMQKVTEVRISGAKSWYNKQKINGRYVPENTTPGKNIVYRNVDTPSTLMVFRNGHWVVMKNNKELAKL